MEVKLSGQALAAYYPAADETIQLYTLENSRGTRLTVSNCGATVVSLLVNDRSGLLQDVVLGYDDPCDYLQDEYYMGSVVGRYANRIAGDTVLIDEHRYKISVRQGGYHQHGGFVGFNKKIFSATTFRQPGASSIQLRYTSPHLEEGFPGQLELEVTYTLDDNDQWIVEYKAVSDKTTLVNLTQHTYFNLSGNPAKGIGNHEMKIMGQYYLPVNAQQVPTGELAALQDTVFDFTEMKRIADDIEQEDEQLTLSKGYDHSFVLEREHTPALKHAAVVTESSTGCRLDVYTTEPAVHFYSGNFLNNVKGKNGITYNQRAGFCLETQHFPDAPNNPHFPSTILPAGKVFTSKTIFKFSIE